MIECKCRIVWCDCGDEIVGQGAQCATCRTIDQDPNPWRYPSRGEWAEWGFWYLVTTDKGEIYVAECAGVETWQTENGEEITVRAWKHLESPAPET